MGIVSAADTLHFGAEGLHKCLIPDASESWAMPDGTPLEKDLSITRVATRPDFSEACPSGLVRLFITERFPDFGGIAAKQHESTSSC